MPNELLKERQSDATLKRWFQDAITAGYPASLMRADGYLEDMAGWDGDPLAKELKGYRWHEYIDPEHIEAVLAWIRDATNPGPISYRGICPINGKPRLMWYGVSKVSGDTLRLLIGTGRPARSAQ